MEDESRDVKNLLQLSKHGRWEDVFKMLNRSPYLVNAIQEDRRWGVIHQVVYWNNEGTLRRLLGYHICDLRLRAKESASEVGDTSRCTAYDIALKYGYTNISELLERQSGHNVTIEENIEGLPTFHYENRDINLNGLGLLRVTLASYKQTFCPFTLTGTKSLNSVFSEIFEFVDRGNQWLTVKGKVCESLYTVCEPAVKVIKGATTKRQFYAKIIHVYTKESFRLYVYSNIALRRQDHRPYRTSAKDLGLGPYILMLHLLLLHWHPLTAENGTTYRRILVKESDANKYQKGTQFVWLSFVSPSIDVSKAAPFPTCRTYEKHNIYIIIDNSTASKSQPRNIEAYGKRVEKERVYPAGTRFIVTDRTEHDDKTTTICLKLID